MGKIKITTRFILSFVLCLSVFTCSVFAQEAVKDEVLKKGIYLFRQENYDEALTLFKGAMKSRPGSSLATYYYALTCKRLQNYVEAKKWFEKSLTQKPRIAGALIELIDLLYRLNEFDEAEKWIKVAETEGVRPAQSKFLKGLTLQKQGEYEQALKAFEEAKDLDDRLTQSADYRIGICYLRMKKYEDARGVFKETYAVDPQSAIATYADQYVEVIERKLEIEKPFHFMARGAFEFDSNVILKPHDTTYITGVQDQDDTRQVFDMKGDYTFRFEDSPFSVKTGYGTQLARQNKMGQYNLFGNTLSAQGNIALDTVLVTFPLNFNHWVVDDKNYLASISMGNVNNILVGDSQLAQAGIIYRYDDYMRPTSLPDERRTGNELIGTAGWFWFFADKEGFVNLRYAMSKDWTKGKNWEYFGNKIGAGVLYPVCDKLDASVNGEVFFQDFSNRHSLYDKERDDQIYAIGSLLSYEFLKNMELQVRYTFIAQRSTIHIYSYDRHVVSTAIQYNF